ncbi:MAG: hypothetical protein KatS3mg114_1422 [Planctomycetaceae bacterium]|nr:MAG: hypothetical protein KatS3mg114_1422 [Planctomycetaceae bacterium]
MSTRRSRWLFRLVATLILAPTILGFGQKFVDLWWVLQGDADGMFALTPVVNYLLATAGFVCLLLWTAAQGAFTEIDRPCRDMFAREQWLDRPR